MLETAVVTTGLLAATVLTKKYWHVAMLSLAMISLKLIITFYPTTSTMVTKWLMIDSLSSSMCSLTAWITMLMILASYKIVNSTNKPTLFIITLLILFLTLIVSFSSSSMLMFYVAFEASLIPTMMLIMLWGYQPERLQASMYLILYTVTASLPLLLMIMYIYNTSKTMNFTMSMILPMSFEKSYMASTLWMLTITAFLVKLPMFMVHLWLPKAHVEAPVAGSMILAAILLKLGGYGIMRMVSTFSNINKSMAPPIMSVALMGGVITSMICLRQSDMKSLIAYSSIGHMALMLAGALSGTKVGIQASLSMMLAHGLSSSAMFCLANMTYNITNTRSVTLTKGLLSMMPLMSMLWFLGCCANMAAPPTINLMSEIFLITATMSQSVITALPLVLISFTTVAYSLYLYSTTNHGQNMMVYNPMPQITPSETALIKLHLVPVVLIMLKPDMIISWY